MYKRIWFKGLDIIKEHTPDEEAILDMYKKAPFYMPDGSEYNG